MGILIFQIWKSLIFGKEAPATGCLGRLIHAWPFPRQRQLTIDGRFITAWQVTWFSVAQIQRIANGLPMTTLELTALSFVPMMLVIMGCWFRKPSIMKPTIMKTKNSKSIEDIRASARASVSCNHPLAMLSTTLMLPSQTHPELSPNPDDWHRTPLDFIGNYRWGIGTHWAYYTGLAEMVHLPIATRPMKSRMWNRYPSDLWLPPSGVLMVYITPIVLFFSSSFLLAWNFHFPTVAERLLWRISSAYHAFFSIYGCLYYLVEALKWKKSQQQQATMGRTSSSLSTNASTMEQLSSGPPPNTPTRRFMSFGRPAAFMQSLPADLEIQLEEQAGRWQRMAATLRNVSSHGDPQMALPLRFSIPVTLSCILYIFCRLYLYIEDFVSFRMQPVGVYITVNRFLPFIG